ncbi:MAG: hydroxymethylglutaryl-CoA lyase [Gammaproteobacteria bacterium]|nr:hydroxymethylglutaryl-CoA lyase [Gammaproteobacteria bacterium]
MPTLPSQVRIIEVAPRDGLQFERTTLTLKTKINFINQLSKTGVSNIEVGSFVSPAHIPQLADSDNVFRGITRNNNVIYSALVPNEIGMQRALAAQADSIAVFTAASETFCQKNIGCSIAESLQRFKTVIATAKCNGLWLRGYLSCAFGCPYENAVPTTQVVKLAKQLFTMGCDEISLGDTIGVATASQAKTLVLQVSGVVPLDKLAVHFHDTRGQALANILSCLQVGITRIDSAVAGLGGCPYAPGASGNIATEDVIYMLNGLGIKTGVNLKKVITTGHYITQQLGRHNASRVAIAGIPDWLQNES